MPATAETANRITHDILIEVPIRFLGTRAWRQNVGKAIPMGIVHEAVALLRVGRVKQGIDLLLNRPVTFGLPGMADISGILAPHGQRVEIEIKSGRDRQSDVQKSFECMIESAGGIYILARDVNSALAELEQRLAGKS